MSQAAKWVMGIRKLNDHHGNPRVDFVVQARDIAQVLDWIRTTPMSQLPTGALHWWTKLVNQLNDEDEIAAGRKRHAVSEMSLEELGELIEHTQNQTWGYAFYLVTKAIEPIPCLWEQK